MWIGQLLEMFSSVLWRAPLSSSGFHLHKSQPYLIYGSSLLFFITLVPPLSQVRAFFGKLIIVLMKYD